MSELRYVDVINHDVVDLSHCSTQERAEWVVRHVEELAEFLERVDGKVAPAEVVHVCRHALQAASLSHRAANLQSAADAARAAAAGSAASVHAPSGPMRRAASLGRCVEKLLPLVQLVGTHLSPEETVAVIRLSLEAALMELTASTMREAAQTARSNATKKTPQAQATGGGA